MNFLFEYIKYRWKAKGRHGTHSPYIYKMVDECCRIPIPAGDRKKINHLLHGLSRDQRILEIADFGAGSKKLTNQRKIRSIFKVSSSKGRFATFFYQISAFYQPKNILEFGTSLGVGTIHFALGNSEAMVTSVEACPQTASVAKENTEAVGVTNVRLINQTFDAFLENKHSELYDVIFIDGHHDGEALQRYVEALFDSMHEETIVILDDIRWSDGMLHAWNVLKDDDRFHVSMDLFRMGILVKRSSQRKEHFTLKIG